MRIIVCVLLAAGVASAQTAQDTAGADPAAAAPSAAPAAPSAAPAAAGLAPGQQNLGPAFYGPGLNNPLAVPLNPLVAQQAQRIAATNPNIRVFVDIDGTAHFTDQFGREVEEILDEFGRDVSELLDVQEQQEQLLKARQQELQRRRQLLELQLIRDFNTNPAAFDPTTGLGAGAAGGVGGTAGAQPGLRVTV
ncbi:uncharacterized protein [Procambarus clarkii]|uniref:uncharacterized protein n=1 Tax=Procambarus clarkii TaxID=6728 RepID=UPI001E671B0F|nr:uncharacterized protein LOC123745241 [Procambarus clarkii]